MNHQSMSIFSPLTNIISQINRRKAELAVLLAFVLQFSFPQVTLSQKMTEPETVISPSIMRDTVRFAYANPADRPEPQPIKVVHVTVTAYSSTPDQTDSTPCITADGFDVCANGLENVIAANFLPIGTQVKIPDYFGDQVFTVHDRMNRRYGDRVDVWMTSRAKAIEFGRHTLKIEVYES